MPATISVYESFDAIPDAVRSALSFPGQPNFFLSLDWFELLQTTAMADTVRPRIYVLGDTDGGVQAALFCCRPQRAGRRELRSLSNFYTIEFDVSVVGAGMSPALARETLVRHIASESPRWDTVNMALARTEASGQPGFAQALALNGFAAHPYFQYENWTHATQGQRFDAYYQERPSQVRNTIQRRQKKLDKAHRSEITVTRGVDAGLDDAVEAFCKVYNASWKEPEPFPAFIPGLIRCAARLGVLRLGVLRVDGQAAAAQLWINASGRAVIYKLAYDEKYAEFGVGSILSRELFRIALDEDAVEVIDYGVGSEAYKKDWMSSVQPLVGTEAFNRSSVVGLALGMAEASKQRLRLLRRAFQARAGLSKA